MIIQLWYNVFSSKLRRVVQQCFIMLEMKPNSSEKVEVSSLSPIITSLLSMVALLSEQ